MGIRARLLVLAVVVAVPLALVGAADLRRVWQSNRSQLDESLKQQAELAAVAFEPAEVVVACARVEAHAAEVGGLRLGVELPAEVPHVSTDREALRRVVCSLIENAIKYTPAGGRITVKAGPASAPGGVEIAVKDTGCGILAEDLPFVFEKFFRGRPAHSNLGGRDYECAAAPGVGLGLYLTRSIVVQLGGDISAESPPRGEREGTVFTVSLPEWRDGGGVATDEEGEDVEALTRG